jgi:hypothetical protein
LAPDDMELYDVADEESYGDAIDPGEEVVRET